MAKDKDTIEIAGVVKECFPNTTFRVDRAYNGVQFALQRADRSSSIFTCVTGTGTQTLADNGFDSVSPEALRLWNLNG